jgi:hypothetical protein
VKRGNGLKRTSLKRGDKPSLKRSEGLRPNPELVREWMRKSATTTRANRRAATPKDVVEAAMERSQSRCIICGRSGSANWSLQPHHVFPVAAPMDSFPELEAVAANVVMLCPGCHDAHERAMVRIPRGKLPRETLELAHGHSKRQLYLDRTYPS